MVYLGWCLVAELGDVLGLVGSGWFESVGLRGCEKFGLAVDGCWFGLVVDSCSGDGDCGKRGVGCVRLYGFGVYIIWAVVCSGYVTVTGSLVSSGFSSLSIGGFWVEVSLSAGCELKLIGKMNGLIRSFRKDFRIIDIIWITCG